MKRALALTLLVLGVLAPGAAARDPEARIINGDPANEGEYPAQGYLEVETSAGFGACGGTVVSPTKFLTAAHCAVEVAADNSIEALPPSAFVVGLGDVTVGPQMDAHFISSVAVHPDYAEDAFGNTNDVAVLTFDAPVTETPMRVIRPSETALWEPGDIATIIGWGVTETGFESDDLLEATAPIRSDADCTNAYGAAFVQSTMVCAGAADPDSGSSDTCQGDSGGPLLVDDGPGFTTTGVVSWGNGCNLEGFPGIYSRIGDLPLNAWVRGQIQSVDFALQTTSPRAGEPVALAAIAPSGGDFSWDFDDNGTTDATGAAVSHVFPLAGEQEVALRITDPDGEAAVQRREFAVGPGAPPRPGGDAAAAAAHHHDPGAAPGDDPRLRRPRHGPPRQVQGPHQLLRHRADRHGDGRGVPRQAQDRHRQDDRPPRRLAAGERKADQAGPAAAEPGQEQARTREDSSPRQAARAGVSRHHAASIACAGVDGCTSCVRPAPPLQPRRCPAASS